MVWLKLHNSWMHFGFRLWNMPRLNVCETDEKQNEETKKQKKSKKEITQNF